MPVTQQNYAFYELGQHPGHSPNLEWIVVNPIDPIIISCMCSCGDEDCGWTATAYENALVCSHKIRERK